MMENTNLEYLLGRKYLDPVLCNPIRMRLRVVSYTPHFLNAEDASERGARENS